MAAQLTNNIKDIYTRYEHELTNAKDYMFWFLLLWTFLFLAMEWVNFFIPSIKAPPTIAAGYLVLLGSYIAHKELIRWSGIELKTKKGEFFVYIWWGTLLLMFMAQYWTGNYHLPEHMPIVPYEVLGYFLLTETSKALNVRRKVRQLG